MQVGFDTAIELFSLHPNKLDRYCRWCFGPTWRRDSGVNTELLITAYGNNQALLQSVLAKKDVLLTSGEACQLFPKLLWPNLHRRGKTHPEIVINFPGNFRYSFLKLIEWRRGDKLAT